MRCAHAKGVHDAMSTHTRLARQVCGPVNYDEMVNLTMRICVLQYSGVILHKLGQMRAKSRHNTRYRTTTVNSLHCYFRYQFNCPSFVDHVTLKINTLDDKTTNIKSYQ